MPSRLMTGTVLKWPALRRNLLRLAAAWRVRALRRRLAKGPPFKVVLGASRKGQPGWILTERAELDLTREEDWARWFLPGSIDVLLAEHVWEHLTSEEGEVGARLCWRHLKPGGRLRLAVPDGFHPDPGYIEWVRIGGRGPGANEHKVLYDYRSLTSLLEKAGFRVELLEYFDELGHFKARPWHIEDGFIRRSHRFDPRNADGRPHYTSLMLDAHKPVVPAAHLA